jgi:hypothetical protein
MVMLYDRDRRSRRQSRMLQRSTPRGIRVASEAGRRRLAATVATTALHPLSSNLFASPTVVLAPGCLSRVTSERVPVHEAAGARPLSVAIADGRRSHDQRCATVVSSIRHRLADAAGNLASTGFRMS